MAVLPLAAGLTGTAALKPAELAAGFRTAVFISGAACAAGGLLAFLTIRNPARQPAPGPQPRCPHFCGVAGPPLHAGLLASAGSAKP